MKCCPTCKETKEETEFYFFRGKPHGHCKVCHRGHSRKSQLKVHYDLTVDGYDLMVKEQSGLCKICKQPGHTNKRQKYPLYVDHNHKTNKVRGLLCATCNTMLGYLENTPHVIEAMQQYLDQNKANPTE